MSRRTYTYSPQCTYEGCPERAHYVLETRREYDDAVRYNERLGGWRCFRHSAPDEVLSAENPEMTTVLESYETDFGYGGRVHRYWAAPGATKGGNGIARGPGFKALAEDFPAGARIIVTARLELPQQ